ncbi:MAG: hypothetical protein H8E45_12365 [Proteobacteria bacterium]|nr:hypothetical protein [Pseudomonadota bacterium]
MKTKGLRLGLLALALAGVVTVYMRADTGDVLELDDGRLIAHVVPELMQRMRDFHRVVTRNGVKLLELRAEEAAYFRDDAAVTISGPEVTFFEEGEPSAFVSGSSGRVYMDGNQVEAIELSGGVSVALGRFHLSADILAWERGPDLLTVSGRVGMDSADLELEGADLELELNLRRLRFRGGVNATVYREPRPWRSRLPASGAVGDANSTTGSNNDADGGDVLSSVASAVKMLDFSKLPADLHLEAGLMSFDYQAGTLVCSREVVAQHGDVRLSADQLKLQFAPSDPSLLRKVKASGSVVVTRGQERATARTATWSRVRRELLLEGNATLGSGDSEVTGESLVVDLENDRTVMDGGEGRVRATISSDDVKGMGNSPLDQP